MSKELTYPLLGQAYNRKDYLDFLKDKFKFSELIQAVSINNSDVKSFEKLGLITTADNKELPIFEIHIKPNTKLERNRVQLRNLVAKQIQTEDGAIAVYINDKNKQWRFSFIAIEYKLGEDGIKKEQTASKRFTYLFGEGEGAKTRTAIQRFKTLNRQSTLADLKTAFAVEGLNKEFYDKLYKWYSSAQKQVFFPNDEKDENHIQTNLIRFLTRILFVWFLKEKKLINQDLFDLEKLKNLIDYEKDSSFYKAILQNLFFATLSTKIKDRKFRSEFKGHKGYNPDFGNQYVFRYQELFQKQDSIQDLFNKTPFLNGGLFECLDDKKNKIYIDGFSSTKKRQPIFPNKLLFNDDEQDLGLIYLFNQYQFTVEESTPTDIEVALDPELLGKIFENLLATYNPETGEQARKATGSFYTPREIVSYMVDESLKQHFKTHTDLEEAKINALFIEGENTFNEQQIKSVINAIDTLKILDPAVGSGAYPMGILQRLVFILDKIDPENEYFKQQELEKLPDLSSIEQDLRTVEKISDKKAKEKATEELNNRKQQIEDKFQKQDHNYLRKLYLIEHCIYGVDIQPIAILIAQLRFFISLTIEQITNKDIDDNFGITPLPNLDYHFETGNSLIGLPENYNTDSIQSLLEQIQPLKHQFFSENDHDKKQALKDDIKEKISNCYQSLKSALGYKIEFDFKIDFSEVFDKSDGFDIVIGNPPYIRQEKIKQWKERFKLAFQTFTGTADIYTYFYEKGFNLLSENGHLCYITSNKWMRAKYGEKLRYFFKNNTGLKQIIDFEGKQIFEHATVDTNILLCGKQKTDNFDYQKQLPNEKNPLFTMAVQDLSDNAYTLQPPEILALKKKIESCGTPLKDWDISINYGIKTGFNKAFIIDNDTKDALCKSDPNSAQIIKPILRGRDIKAYESNWAGLWIIFIPWHFPLHKDKSITGASEKAEKAFQGQYPIIYNHLLQYKDKLSKRNKAETGIRYEWYAMQRCANTYYEEFAKEKIVYPNMTKFLPFIYDKEYFFTNQKCFIITGKNLKYLTSYLNSKLFKAVFKNNFPELQGGTRELSKVFFRELCIPQIPKLDQQPFVKLADKIIQAKQHDKDTTTLETQIDKMVYQLYDLTADEIKIIENKD